MLTTQWQGAECKQPATMTPGILITKNLWGGQIYWPYSLLYWQLFHSKTPLQKNFYTVYLWGYQFNSASHIILPQCQISTAMSDFSIIFLKGIVNK